jgi:hypothetical protein
MDLAIQHQIFQNQDFSRIRKFFTLVNTTLLSLTEFSISLQKKKKKKELREA